MIKRNTWILLAVFVVVLGAAYGIQQTNLFGPQVSPTATPNPSLLDLTNNQVSGIQLVDQHGLNVVVKLGSNKQWSIVQPPDSQISQGNVQEILSELGGIAIQSTILNPLPLDSTGLQLPTYTLTLTYASGQTHIIKVGSLTATKSGYYIQLDSGNTVIVNQSGVDSIIEMLKSVTYTPTPTNPPETATPIPSTPSTTATPRA